MSVTKIYTIEIQAQPDHGLAWVSGNPDVWQTIHEQQTTVRAGNTRITCAGDMADRVAVAVAANQEGDNHWRVRVWDTYPADTGAPPAAEVYGYGYRIHQS